MNNKTLHFGDYCLIEQKRYNGKNEMYLHKVINCLKSNTYVNTPVVTPIREITHDKVVPVISCICCGIIETEVKKYRICDVTPVDGVTKTR